MGFEVFLKWGEQRECGSEPESIKTVWNKSPSLTHTDDAEGFIVLSEVSQTEKRQMYNLLHVASKTHTHTHPNPMGTESTQVVARGRGWRGERNG